MISQEVEDYLARGGDTMFIAMGVVEVHGACPIDCETAATEALSLAMAEEADGLAMINLPYFYPGGTVISNSTVHITIRDGIDFLMKICGSLVDQGFKRLYLISGHGPSQLTANAFCREFFDARHIHVCHMATAAIQGKVNEEIMTDWISNALGLDALIYGAYKMLGQLDYIPIDPNAQTERGERIPIDPAMNDFMDLYRPYAGYGATAQLFSDPGQHGGGKLFKSREELEEFSEKGVKHIYDLVSKIHLKELNAALANYQKYVAGVVEKYPRVK